MVQNKDIINNTGTNDGEAKQLKTNGVLTENEYNSDSEDDEDFTRHLLIVPTLDKAVAERNTCLISQQLFNFFSAIENRKEYQRIKQDLMEGYEPATAKKQESTTTFVENVNNELKCNGTEDQCAEKNGIEQFAQKIEVKLEVEETKNCSIVFHKAKIVPEHEPNMYDQFFVCRRCKIFFKGRKFRKLHNMMKHRRKKNDSEQMKTRKIRSAKGEPLICDLCSRTFKIKALIRSHMNSHLSEKLHQCKLCSYASKRYNDLRKHHQTHHDPNQTIKKRTRRRKCDKCDEILSNKKALRVHIRLKHQEKRKRKPKVFKTCEKCNEALYNKKSFKLHMKEKHGESSFIKCETCNRRFKTNFRLRKHKNRYAELKKDCRIRIRVKKIVKEFICEHCNAKFTLKSHLSLHMSKHKTFDCMQCNASFKSQFSLKYHEFSHLDVEPKCNNCSKILTSENKFANHLKKKNCLLNGHANSNDL